MRGSDFLTSLFRKKTFQRGSQLESDMKRCLTVLDVTFLAVGQMVGAGIYVLTGSVVRNLAGPSIIFSFLLAGFAALLSAFSYAEFGARFPRAGSAYTYAYVGIGELWAFVIGWTVLLEYMIGNAAVARSWSGYFDNLIDNRVHNFTLETVGSLSEGGGFFSQYPDVLAFLLIVFVAIAVAIGSKASANVNTSFVVINLGVLAFVIVCGFIHADVKLWAGNDEKGVSRFFPYGLSGTMAGAATCFFSYVGFEAIGTAGEEAKNPQRTIPLATFCSLVLVTTIYILMSAALTLMVPYDQVHPAAAFSAAFDMKGATIAKYVVSIGALAGMMNNLLTGVFALPRAVYAMADDGLLFSFLAVINKHTKVPLNAIIVFTLLNAVLALVFDLEALVEFLSIGTLSAYSIVSACVILLRHQSAPIDDDPQKMDDGGTLYSWVPFRNFWESLPEGRSISIAVVAMVIGDLCLAVSVRTGMQSTETGYGYAAIAVSALIILLSFTFIVGHRQNSLTLSFKVPLVPFVPSVGLLINVFMMAYLNAMTWIRLFVWMSIGLLIYFCYGFTHSKEGNKSRAIRDSTQMKNSSTMTS